MSNLIDVTKIDVTKLDNKDLNFLEVLVIIQKKLNKNNENTLSVGITGQYIIENHEKIVTYYTEKGYKIIATKVDEDISTKEHIEFSFLIGY